MTSLSLSLSSTIPPLGDERREAGGEDLRISSIRRLKAVHREGNRRSEIPPFLDKTISLPSPSLSLSLFCKLAFKFMDLSLSLRLFHPTSLIPDGEAKKG